MKGKQFLILAIMMVALAAISAVSAEVVNCSGTAVNGVYPKYVDNESAVFNVTAGNVCINATSYDVDPTATKNCDQYFTCVAGATSVPSNYVGFTATGTGACTTTGQVAGPTTTLADGLHVRSTGTELSVCSTTGYNAAYSKGDFTPIVTDGLGTAGASAVSWIDLIITLLVLMFIVGIVMKAKGMF